MYNLAPETEENVLWQLFGPFGAVQSVKVVNSFQLLIRFSSVAIRSLTNGLARDKLSECGS